MNGRAVAGKTSQAQPRVTSQPRVIFFVLSRKKYPNIKRKYINNSSHLARKYARVFVRGHYLFREANSFPRAKLEETVSYEEQIMSKDKHPSIFPRQMAIIVFIILEIFFATHAVCPKGLRVTSPRGEAEWAINPWPLRAKGLIGLCNK